MKLQWDKLNPNQQRGSKPRCHLLTHASSNQEVAKRLTNLIIKWGSVTEEDFWLPQGFENVTEAQLDKTDNLLEEDSRKKIKDWWPCQSNTPTWDIASTCSIHWKKGFLLIEAKAHDQELYNEMQGKQLDTSASEKSENNDEEIHQCIIKANTALSRATGIEWNLSADHHYQMSNRFAWAWKVTELGFPVILVYLGFLNADEMSDKGKPFESHKQWEDLVKLHSGPLFPDSIWNQKHTLNGQTFIPLIKSYEEL